MINGSVWRRYNALMPSQVPAIPRVKHSRHMANLITDLRNLPRATPLIKYADEPAIG